MGIENAETLVAETDPAMPEVPAAPETEPTEENGEENGGDAEPEAEPDEAS